MSARVEKYPRRDKRVGVEYSNANIRLQPFIPLNALPAVNLAARIAISDVANWIQFTITILTIITNDVGIITPPMSFFYRKKPEGNY